MTCYVSNVSYAIATFERKSKGSSINDVTTLGGMGQVFCDDSTKASVIKRVTIGGRGVQNCVTSFMDDPLTISFRRQELFTSNLVLSLPHNKTPASHSSDVYLRLI